MKIINDLKAVRNIVREGLDLVAIPVGRTLGPNGMLVTLSDRTTKDGYTVAQAVTSDVPELNRIINMTKEVALGANNNQGDGTTTATVIGAALVHKAIDAMEKQGINHDVLSREIAAAKAHVLSELDRLAIKDVTKELLYSVALVSSNGDEDVARVVSDAVWYSGPTGTVTSDITSGDSITSEYSRGYVFNGGYMFSDAAFSLGQHNAVFDNPVIVLAPSDGRQFNDSKMMFDSIEPYLKNGKHVVVIFANVSDQVIQNAVHNIKSGKNNKITIIRIAITDNGIANDVLNDLSVVTGAKLIGAGTKWEHIKNGTGTGTCSRLILAPHSAEVLHSIEDEAPLWDYHKSLLERAETEKDANMQFFIKARASSIIGKSAAIKVGAPSLNEAQERHDRVIDAILACKSAITGGVIHGGGVTLLHIADRMEGTDGMKIMASAIRKPYEMMVESSGIKDGLVAYPGGYDFRSKEAKLDMAMSGIVDPLNVACTAVTQAHSLAEVMIRIGSIVI